jgi:hypothetical protein
VTSGSGGGKGDWWRINLDIANEIVVTRWNDFQNAFPPGQRVMVNWHGSGVLYDGVVVGWNGGSWYCVWFDEDKRISSALGAEMSLSSAAIPSTFPKKYHNLLDQHGYFCDTCLKGGDLLCCNHCTLVFHTECLNPPMKKIPKGDWLCPACVKEGAVAKTVVSPVAKKRTKIANIPQERISVPESFKNKISNLTPMTNVVSIDKTTGTRKVIDMVMMNQNQTQAVNMGLALVRKRKKTLDKQMNVVPKKRAMMYHSMNKMHRAMELQAASSGTAKKSGRKRSLTLHCWSDEEQLLLLAGYRKYGNSWTDVAHIVGTQTNTQCKNRFQTWTFQEQYLNRESQLAAKADAIAFKDAAALVGQFFYETDDDTPLEVLHHNGDVLFTTNDDADDPGWDLCYVQRRISQKTSGQAR